MRSQMKNLLIYLALIAITQIISAEYYPEYYPVNYGYKFGVRSPFITDSTWNAGYPLAKNLLIYGTPASWYVDDEFDGGIRQDQSDY